MTRRSQDELTPRNGHTLIVGVIARISGCQNQKELSLDDQVDHAKEEVAGLYSGPVDYRVIATKGKGERLDRPELAEMERIARTGELDLLVMEDVGRLVRGAEAVRLWGIAVDHGVRCIAPNDCLDTVDETWEEDLLSACRDHVGHNAHTSKRLKKKLMNRFVKFGGAAALPIAGYTKPDDAKTYYDWLKDDAATEIIREGLKQLRASRNCSQVADYFKAKNFPPGPYCRRLEWNGQMVRRYYRNRLLAGHPGRGFRRTVKHNESGRRLSVKNSTGEECYLDCPHLAHVDAAELDDVNRLLDEENANCGRKKVNGVDPLWRKSRKRTQFPGQYARCWYCGHHYVWGANGITKNLMCSNAREWRCWNSVGFNGELAARKIVEAITSELHKCDGFDQQFAELVKASHQQRCGGSPERWRRLQRDEEALAREKANLTAAILKFGARQILEEKLIELETKESELRRERCYLESLRARELVLPASVSELRQLFETEFANLAIESPECGMLLQQLVPGFYVYLVRLCDGGHLLPRAQLTLNLAGHIADAQHVPELCDFATKVVTIDLFERPPQRERIRNDVVRLAASGVPQRAIARRLQETPKLPAVQKALALDAKMRELGLESPYVMVTAPPDDYRKLRRHKNPKYRFEPADGYQPPPLES